MCEEFVETILYCYVYDKNVNISLLCETLYPFRFEKEIKDKNIVFFREHKPGVLKLEDDRGGYFQNFALNL